MVCVDRVLVVEDEVADALLLKRAFLGISPLLHVDLAEDGVDALNMLLPPAGARRQIGYPNCILLDLKLRQMDGHEVLKELKGNDATRAIPIIVLTSSSEPADVQMAYSLGANSYIVKPNRLSDLKEVAARVYDYWVSTNHQNTSSAA